MWPEFTGCWQPREAFARLTQGLYPATAVFFKGLLKNNWLLSLVIFCAFQPLVQAQSVTQGVQGVVNTNGGIMGYTVVGRALNSRVWATISAGTNQAGAAITTTNSSYTEVGANLCVQDANGVWSDSDGSLARVPDGAGSVNSPLAVHFSGDANADGGTVRLTAAGKIFVCKAYGISWYDPLLQTNVLIASLQSSQGQLVGNNHVYFPNAFSGGLNADLWYTFSPSGGLEQDIVIHAAPSPPTAYNLSEQGVRLQVWTEWLTSPEPRITTGEHSGITYDDWIDFGGMVMVPGAALFTQGQADPAPVESGAIYKHWTSINGRTWLIEEIGYDKIANLLQALPLHASAGKAGRNLYEDIASTEGLGPKIGVSEKSRLEVRTTLRGTARCAGVSPYHSPATPVQVAKDLPRKAGLVLDYSIVSSINPFVFQGDSTYFMSTNVLMSGTNNTTFEAGTILKYASNASLTVNTPVSWLGQNYRPVCLVSKDEDSMGDTISGSTGNPGTNYYAATALSFNGTSAGTNLVLHNLRVLNAKKAVAITGNTNHVLSNVQMVNCGTGIAATNSSFSLWNALMYNVMTNFNGHNSVGDVEHLTVDTANCLNTNVSLSLTNCLLVAVAHTNAYTNCQVSTSSSGAGVFETMGDGSHYMTNSKYLNAGTANINPTLAAALAEMTTFPPVVYSNILTSFATNLGIQALRDAEAPGPTLGYHYDPLDWVFGGTYITGNLTFAPGTGVGWFNGGSSGYGIWMSNTTIASFRGTATRPVWWVRANTVQEGGSGTVWPGVGSTGGLVGDDNQYNEDISLSPQANLFFTHCSILGFGDGGGLNHFRDNWGYLIVNAAHSEFHGGALGGYVLSCYFTNCLLDRVLIAQVEGHSNNAVMVTNCTWHGGSLTLTPWYKPVSIAVRDSAFDGTNIVSASGYGANTNYASYDYNAFTNTNTLGRFPIGGLHDVFATNGFNWQSSWFGNYYLPNNSPLTNAGDVTANIVGLYHFTTQTNQVPQGFSQVDIGYHYVATDSSGNPLDTAGDGMPDYVKDSNGDGVYDSGDLCDWLNPFNIYDQWVNSLSSG